MTWRHQGLYANRTPPLSRSYPHNTLINDQLSFFETCIDRQKARSSYSVFHKTSSPSNYLDHVNFVMAQCH